MIHSARMSNRLEHSIRDFKMYDEYQLKAIRNKAKNNIVRNSFQIESNKEKITKKSKILSEFKINKKINYIYNSYDFDLKDQTIKDDLEHFFFELGVLTIIGKNTDNKNCIVDSSELNPSQKIIHSNIEKVNLKIQQRDLNILEKENDFIKEMITLIEGNKDTNSDIRIIDIVYLLFNRFRILKSVFNNSSNIKEKDEKHEVKTECKYSKHQMSIPKYKEIKNVESYQKLIELFEQIFDKQRILNKLNQAFDYKKKSKESKLNLPQKKKFSKKNQIANPMIHNISKYENQIFTSLKNYDEIINPEIIKNLNQSMKITRENLKFYFCKNSKNSCYEDVKNNEFLKGNEALICKKSGKERKMKSYSPQNINKRITPIELEKEVLFSRIN